MMMKCKACGKCYLCQINSFKTKQEDLYTKAAFENDNNTANDDQEAPDLNDLDWNTPMPVRYEGESVKEQESSATIAKNSQDDATTTIDDQGSQIITRTQDSAENLIADEKKMPANDPAALVPNHISLKTVLKQQESSTLIPIQDVTFPAVPVASAQDIYVASNTQDVPFRSIQNAATVSPDKQAC